nr:uncharacterized protein LOC119159877 isoform X2 [Rhipicephalus microplus]
MGPVSYAKERGERIKRAEAPRRREVVEVTPEFTSVTNSRERFVVVAMSALLLLISCTLFAVLFTLLSDDRTSTKSKEAIYAACRAFSFARGWSIRDT